MERKSVNWKSKKTCENSEYIRKDHFTQAGKMVQQEDLYVR